jgi:hypothetical protein
MEMSEAWLQVPFHREAQEVKLMTLQEVVAALRRGEFKLNCAMTWMAFLIRHGVVNADNEPQLVEIEARMRRKHDLFSM